MFVHCPANTPSHPYFEKRKKRKTGQIGVMIHAEASKPVLKGRKNNKKSMFLREYLENCRCKRKIHIGVKKL